MDWEFYSSTLSLPPPGGSDYLFLLEINFLFGCFYGRVTQRFISVSGGTALHLPTAAQNFFFPHVKHHQPVTVAMFVWGQIIREQRPNQIKNASCVHKSEHSDPNQLVQKEISL